MLIFSAVIFIAIVFCLRLAAFVLLLPIIAAAAALAAVNIASLRCDMGISPIAWDVCTVFTAFKSVSLIASNIFLGAAVTVDFCRLFICYLLCSVTMVIWWIIREQKKVLAN